MNIYLSLLQLTELNEQKIYMLSYTWKHAFDEERVNDFLNPDPLLVVDILWLICRNKKELMPHLPSLYAKTEGLVGSIPTVKRQFFSLDKIISKFVIGEICIHPCHGVGQLVR